MSHALSICCYGARVLVVEDVGADVCGRLGALLPREARAEDAGEPDVRYTVRRPEPDEPTGSVSYHVTRDDRLCHRARTVEDAARWLRADIDTQVAVLAREGLFVHAGVVGWRDRAILVPGRTMTGKSSLVAALVRQGATYYSDEYAVLAGDGRVHPYARPLSLRDGSGPDRMFAVDRLGEAERAPMPVSLIVSTAYREGTSWCPEVLRGARAVLPLIDNTVLARREPERTVRLAGRLAHSVVTLQGPRPDAAIVAPRILEVLDDLLAGRPGGVERTRHANRRGGGAYPLPRPARPAGRESTEAEQTAEPAFPARYLRVENALEPAEHRRLLEHTVALASEFKPSSVIPPGGPARVDPMIRRSRNIRGLDAVRDLFEARLRGLLPEVRKELGVPWFPFARIEYQLTVHDDGDFFGVHTDNGAQAVASRQITAVYYFHRAPKRFSGGQLRLYDGVLRNGWIEPASTYAALEPVDNSLVFFPSGLFHEVCRVHCETAEFRDGRFAINMWYCTAQFPGRGTGTEPSPAPPQR